jgi:hypothetical protein
MNSDEQPRGLNGKDLEAVCRRILSFLRRHPEAEDAVEAIAEWWLLERDTRFELDRVQEALHRLVRRKQVLVRSQPGGRAYYRANRARTRKPAPARRRTK